MRLHRLEMSAFGPFRDRQLVDFDELSGDGLFLLHGDTGAGKTTVLDAIVFALYGEVPGARNQIKALRCDTSDPATPTRVSLELSVQGHRLRVERNPEYERPKKSGQGSTTEKAKASLTWLNEPPSGEMREGITRPAEVRPTIERLLGVDAKQFCHVALLPQGDFARFLRADAKERGDLLERLFGTRRFSAVEKWFRDTRHERGRELEQRRGEADRLLARLAQVVGSEPLEEEDRAAWLEGVEKSFTRESERARGELDRLRRQREQADDTLAKQRELADRVGRVRTARSELDELAAESEQHGAARAELEAARRATSVVDVGRTVDRATAALRESEAELREARAACPDVDTDSPADPEELRALAVRYRERAAVLESLEPEAEQQRGDRERITELDERIAADAAADADLAERVGQLPAAVERARAEVHEAEQAPERLEVVRRNREELDAALRAARELPAAETRSVEARDRERRAVDDHQGARAELQRVRELRLAGMAAELAAELDEGTACPVCGGTRHPEPAEPHERTVGAEDERLAREKEAELQRWRDEQRGLAEEAERECARLREQVGERTEQWLRSELDRATSERDRLSELVAQRETRAARLAELETRSERLGERRSELAERLATARSSRDSLAEQVREREQRLSESRGEFDTVTARRRYLVERAERIDRLAAAEGDHDRASARESEQRAELARTAADNGFETPEQALAARRERRRVEELEEWLAEVDRREAAARATLRELADVPVGAEVDVAAAAEAADRAREAAQEAATTAADLDRRVDEITELGRQLRESWKELEPVEAEFAELDALTDVINGQGQNARRMTLRSYVLAARLEEVAEAATQRLGHMSDGRYSFVHSDEQGPHGKRGGLDLRVVDDYSGRTRSTKTLSGGETFLASLALALGLADVVSAEAGGAMLDTLFIDEGFGTLDGDTLDLVMDALDELRAGGRVVGLVSHVDELRQRIPVRLRVRKSRGGSSLAIES
ncbi:exonuclease SbcC [Actinopolyspora biskrensis]|uniref:Nuclease SbcCD subunit C n=1 Tax=Actinopolyspora biskrensis TaxID=1470178 RepID=A0A852Z1V7_9ACTN|nr:SMC family ATPase [Actinopolyspora biskrensis]NYH80170.1 exonuclease SbcC [Actinopolyspora biskrensis]